jgi:hypothetical protein
MFRVTNFTVPYSKTCNISASSENLYYNLCRRNKFACARTDTHTQNLIYQKKISSLSCYVEALLSRIFRQESSNRITVSSKFERIWTEYFIVGGKAIFRNRHRRTEWNRENLNKDYLTCRLLNFVPENTAEYKPGAVHIYTRAADRYYLWMF